MRPHLLLAFLVFGLTAAAGLSAAEAPDIMREWTAVRAPRPPQLTPVTIDPRTTALLLTSFYTDSCAALARPRCAAAIPKVKALLDAARASRMLVVHGLDLTQAVSSIVPALAPIAGEPIIRAPADKFLNSRLNENLRVRFIDTVIVTGTSGNGAVLFTVVGGATQGFNLIVPVDTMPADSAFHEQFALVEMNDVGFVRSRTKLTRSDMLQLPGQPPARSEASSGVMSEWPSIKPPAPPKLSAVKVNAQKTALLVMDFIKRNCTLSQRRRCVAAIPRVRKLLDEARAQGCLVIHIVTPNMTREDIVAALAPLKGEPVLQVQGDKFYGSDLDLLLQGRGIGEVIATGTSGNGAVLLTTIGGVSRGYTMIVPIDTMPSDSAYHEQFSIFEIADVKFLAARAKLTRSDMIAF